MGTEQEREDAKTQIVEWNATLQKARDAYYKNAEPIMTDAAYDLMERQLRRGVEIFPEFRDLAPVIDTVGSDLEDLGDGRFKHLTPMLSIENVYNHDELKAWYDEVCETLGLAAVDLELEPKVDGLSCALHFRHGLFQQALTRGDGTFGEDVTPVILEQENFPKRVTFPKEWEALDVEIRGEVAITHQEFERINKAAIEKGEKTYSNCRNLASGTLKMKDPVAARARKLIFIPWQILIHKEGQRGQIALGPEALRKLEHLGFRQYLGRAVRMVAAEGRCPEKDVQHQNIIDTLENVAKERDTLWSVGLGIDTDGVVIKVADPALRKKLADSSKYQGSMRAWKFQSLSGETILRKVIWQTGRSGKMTPVGVCDPVNLGGAMVTRVNLNNWTFMKDLGVTIGGGVEILRSGDVIPYPQRAWKTDESVDIKMPSKCPGCGEALEPFEDKKSNILTFWCLNEQCPGRISDYLAYVAQRSVLDIDGLGDETAKLWVEKGLAVDLADLMEFSNRALPFLQTPEFEEQAKGAGLPVAGTRTLMQSLQAVKTREWDRWIMAFGIPGVGASFATTLAMHFRLQSDDMLMLIGRLLKLKETDLEGLGVKKLQNIKEWCMNPNNARLLLRLHEAGVTPKPLIEIATSEKPLPLAGYVICITGELRSGERDYVSKELTKLGAVMKTSVSKKLNLLLCGDAPGRTKLMKAKELNIRMEKENWLEKVFADNNIESQANPFTAAADDDDIGI
jgi:DNA ligase (NAD+)